MTDRQTDRRTDIQNRIAMSVSRISIDDTGLYLCCHLSNAFAMLRFRQRWTSCPNSHNHFLALRMLAYRLSSVEESLRQRIVRMVQNHNITRGSGGGFHLHQLQVLKVSYVQRAVLYFTRQSSYYYSLLRNASLMRGQFASASAATIL